MCRQFQSLHATFIECDFCGRIVSFLQGSWIDYELNSQSRMERTSKQGEVTLTWPPVGCKHIPPCSCHSVLSPACMCSNLSSHVTMRVSFKRLLPSTHTHTSLFLSFLMQLDLRQNQDESFIKRMFLHRPRNVCLNKRHRLESRVCISASIGSPRSPVCLMFCVGSQVRILLMLQQAGDWQIHLLVMDDHPILGKQTKLPVDPVVKQYYILIRLYSMES